MAATNVRDLVIRLLGDDEQRAAFEAEPGATLARHGFAGFSDADVSDLVGHVAASVPASDAAPLLLFGEDGWHEFVDEAPGFDPLTGTGAADTISETETVELDTFADHDTPDDADEEFTGWDFDQHHEPLDADATGDETDADDLDDLDTGDHDDPFDFDLG